MAAVIIQEEVGAVHWVGVDVAKDTFDVGLVRQGQHYPKTPLRDIPAETFARTPSGVGEFLAWLDTFLEQGDSARAVMESTGSYSIDLAVWMLTERPSLTPAIVNAYSTAHFIKSMQVRNKTDRLEARALGFYGVERRPMAYEPPTPERAELRGLSRYREDLIQIRTAEKNRTKEVTEFDLAKKLHENHLHQLNENIKQLENDMKRVVNESPELKHDIELLISIYGVGQIIATVIIAELGDLRRFRRARQLSAYTGVSPKTIHSGISVNGRTRMCKQGNPRVRHALYMAALTAIRQPSDLQDTYNRIYENKGKKMIALGAVMRKLLLVMRVLLITENEYDPHYKKRTVYPNSPQMHPKNA